MNPVASIETAIQHALGALLPSYPGLAGIPFYAAMAEAGDDLPCIIHATATRPAIATNHTHEAAVAFGVLTSTETDETTHQLARQIATDLAVLVLGESFRLTLRDAACNAPHPFLICGPIRLGDAAEVQPRDSAVWHQGCQVTFLAQF